MDIGLLIFLIACVSFLLLRIPWKSWAKKIRKFFSPRQREYHNWSYEINSSLGYKSPQERWRFYVGILVTLAVLGSSLFIILNGAYEDSTEKWAFGSVGTIVGYWLKA